MNKITNITSQPLQISKPWERYLWLSQVLILFLISITSFSQTANSHFVEGNKLYQQEKYNEAIEQYLKIENAEQHSAEVYYNLANAYYKTNKVAPAILYYEKALKLAPNNKDIKVNLDFAKQMTLDNIEALPITFIQKLSKKTIQKLDYNSWAYIAVLFSFIFAILFLVYHFTDGTTKKRLYFTTGTISFILILFSVFFAFKTFLISNSKHEAIIFSQQTEIKDAPMMSGETIFKLHEGTKVNVLETKDNWKKIKIADGQTGWIVGSEIRLLDL